MGLETGINGKNLLEKQKQLNLIVIQIAMMSLKVVQNMVFSTYLADALLMMRFTSSVIRRITFQECVASMPRKVMPSLQRDQ